MVLHSAHTAARFARVAPEVQFLVTIFQKDLRDQQQSGASFGQQWTLFRLTMQTMSGLYQLHNIHPLTLFLSPLLQIPIFWYASVDLRKIVNGADPALAQQLAESSVLWVPDLTEPDPWFGLPILAGILLYLNVEVAVGSKSLSGETASKSNIAMYLKDFFQSESIILIVIIVVCLGLVRTSLVRTVLAHCCTHVFSLIFSLFVKKNANTQKVIAVFMPCFMSQQPAGMQIYLCTSFLFTLVQGGALRHDGIRAKLNLPKMHVTHEAELAKEFMQLKELERKAQELRGDGPLLGTGVLAMGLEASFAGTNRPSTIVGSNPNGGPLVVVDDDADEWEGLTTPSTVSMSTLVNNKDDTDHGNEWQEGVPFIHGISAPRKQKSLAPDPNSATTSSSTTTSSSNEEYMPTISHEVMEAANRGEFPPTAVQMAPLTKKVDSRLDPKRFLARRRKKGRKPR
jgi:membrane protein insertase Oxa1/YidC/SpoIIIJ